MDPTIQLIQLTLRIEREAERQRRPSVAYKDDFADENPVRPSRRENRVKGNFKVLYRQQQCECA